MSLVLDILQIFCKRMVHIHILINLAKSSRTTVLKQRPQNIPGGHLYNGDKDSYDIMVELGTYKPLLLNEAESVSAGCITHLGIICSLPSIEEFHFYLTMHI